MFVSSKTTPAQRRGIVLVLILGMLGLLALIGVTFATFSGQARINARNFAQAQGAPDSTQLMDFALSQLIDDTYNPQSALMGHSLKRDMYGTDAAFNGYLTGRPSDNAQMLFQTNPPPTLTTLAVSNDSVKRITNIPVGDESFYGFNFDRWIVTFSSPYVSGSGAAVFPVGQTFEILHHDPNDGSGFHALYLAPPDSVTMGVRSGFASGEPGRPTTSSALIGETFASGVPGGNPGIPTGLPFVLDGRYLHAFNGTGMGPLAVYGDFSLNGPLLGGATMVGNPDAVGMDEDYDACDLENWFLAIQSADGRVIVPSFHRPGILRADPTDSSYGDQTYSISGPAVLNDWRNTSLDSRARFLRPRAIDGHSSLTFPDLLPNPATGQLTFDVDNDGDGNTDSVWLDLGFPAQLNAKGQLYKPLFAFKVIGLNGKIPLNTAGNLARRDITGAATYQHASRLGYSPSEVDPTFALQNYQNPPGFAPQFDNSGSLGTSSVNGLNAGTPDGSLPVNLTQLRNILTGTYPYVPSNVDANYVINTVNGIPTSIFLPNNVYDAIDTGPVRAGAPVAGRWGESSLIVRGFPTDTNGNLIPYVFNNAVRAGLSALYPPKGTSVYPTMATSVEADDDDFNTFDAYPAGGPETADYYDASGTLGMPVERERRNVTPKDIVGDGMVGQYNTFVGGAALTAPLNTGPDAWGRVSYYKYFRPPGMAPGPNYAAPAIPDVQNNLLHAFEMQRFPQTIASASQRDMLLLGTMPSDLAITGGMTSQAPVYYGGPTAVPTFDSYINSGTADIAQGATPYNTITPGINGTVYAWYSAGFNDANEMNLYTPDGNDQAFGPTDLEWLYRYQDVDGSSLSSRLSSLAPVSLVSSGDALRRRRLFSTDTSELISSVWANDNPGNVFPFNSRFPWPANYQVANPLSNASLTSYSTQLGVYIPSAALAHRERKINLNYPLPNVNVSDEPTRQKWVLDAYRVLLSVLPPLAIDTPEEQLQVSQFLLNVIDFRDPDSTMTHFINPDYKIRPGTGPAAPATLIPIASAMASDQPVDQYGMEYAPVAINEVLAFSYLRKDNGGNKGVGGDHGTAGAGYIDTATPRFFVELVNTLTQSATPSPANAALNTSDLDLGGGGLIPGAAWDLVVAPDDVLNRPDPNTGQFHQDVAGTPVFGTTTYGTGPIVLNSTSFTAVGGGAGANVVLPALTSTTAPIPPVTTPPTPGHYFYVIGNQPPPIASSQPPNPEQGNQFNVDQILAAAVDPFTNYSGGGGPTKTTVPYLTRTGAGMSKYYWLYLRRPANPFAPSTPPGYVASAGAPANPMVVVDCIRFPYIEAGSTVTNTDQSMPPDADSVTVGANQIYSVQRLQPMRGGQVVPSAITPATLDSRYGYTEQVGRAAAGSGLNLKYGSSAAAAPNKILSNNLIFHTLQANNSGAQSAAGAGGDRWRYLPFNDRDFTSVAELLLVPGCPPGLFTKQFIEVVPTAGWVAPAPNANPPLVRPAAAANLGGGAPASLPYLVDEFYYTAQDPGAAVAIPVIGGTTSAGWFKMFEFLEVPSPVIGATGTASNGVNYDWFRQDLRPGLLNINLILDEEVFLGLVGNAGMPNIPIGPGQDLLAGQIMNQAPQSLNGIQIAANLPQVVTLVDPNTGLPAVLAAHNASYNVNNVGMYDYSVPGHSLKACFSDFLKLRHGASGYLFSYGTTAIVGGAPTTVIPPDRPFHSLSYPDINYTLMRPAAIVADTSGTPPSPAPGLKNPAITNPPGAGVPQVMPPPIPPRRLFQIPDNNATSNASPLGDGYAFKELATSALTANLYNTNVDLTNPAAEFGTVAGDRRPHPYYRSEWMQRVTNLTTVRTHQYAVWITIGLFQVTSQGDPSLVNDPNYFTLAQDKIGTEIGLLSGETTRYRSFFIIDRTKAFGFNPQNPGDFHSVIVYRNDIE